MDAGGHDSIELSRWERGFDSRWDHQQNQSLSCNRLFALSFQCQIGANFLPFGWLNPAVTRRNSALARITPPPRLLVHSDNPRDSGINGSSANGSALASCAGGLSEGSQRMPPIRIRPNLSPSSSSTACRPRTHGAVRLYARGSLDQSAPSHCEGAAPDLSDSSFGGFLVPWNGGSGSRHNGTSRSHSTFAVETRRTHLARSLRARPIIKFSPLALLLVWTGVGGYFLW